jgi:hypothetical protein
MSAREHGEEVAPRFLGEENVDTANEVLRQVAVYAGFPTAWNGLATATQAFRAFDEAVADGSGQ